MNFRFNLRFSLLVLIALALAACNQPGSFSLPLDETIGARLGAATEQAPAGEPDQTQAALQTQTGATEGEAPSSGLSSTVTVQPTPGISVRMDSLRGAQVRFWHPWSGDTGLLMREMVEEFNTTNEWGIQVSAASPGGLDEIDSAAYSAIQEGQAPDLSIGYLHHAYGWDAAQALADLTPYLNNPVWGISPEELADYNAAYLEPGTRSGERLALPALALGQVLYYNQTWAQELGFEQPPATPPQLIQQACRAAQANNQDDSPDNDGAGGLILSTNYSATLGWIGGFGGQVYDPAKSDSKAGPYNFNQAAVTDAFTLLRNLYDQGCAFLPEDGYPEDEFASRRGLFAANSITNLPYQASLMERSGSGDQWTVIPFPSPDGQPVMDAYGPYYVMFSSTPERELAAWLFLRWLIQPENQARLVESTGSLPLRNKTLDLLGDYQANHPQWAAAVGAMAYARPEPWDRSWNLVRWAVSDATTQLFRSYFTLAQVPELASFLHKTAAELHAWVIAGGS